MLSPVLFLLFNRPETTFQTFQAIREARPPKLYIAADGPRENKIEDIHLCQTTRRVSGLVDWPCEVHTLFRKSNLGCAKAVSSAITWFFSQEEQGVILEDDTLPEQDFFPYCDILLEKYRDHEQILSISGFNSSLGGEVAEQDSYFFSRFFECWGWASWRRAWALYDISMQGAPRYLHQKLPFQTSDPLGQALIRRMLHETSRGMVSSWAVPFSYCHLSNDGLCITPKYSLVRNIGLSNGTHTVGENIWQNTQTYPMPEIHHPQSVALNDPNEKFRCRLIWGETDPQIIFEEGIQRLKKGNLAAYDELIRMAQTKFKNDPTFVQLTEIADVYRQKATHCDS